MKLVKIKGIGAYLPEKILTNDDLSKTVDTSDDWIFTRTGMRERHIAADNEVTSDLCSKAALRAIINAKINKNDIDLIVVGTMTPDTIFPSTATVVQSKLGLKNIPCFDFCAACSGFQYGLEIVDSMLKSGRYRNALLICGDKMSSIVDWQDRTTCVLFGDGAGAIILSTDDAKENFLVDSLIGADGTFGNILCMPAGGSSMPASEETVVNRQHFLKMNGKEVFKLAVRGMCECATTILERNSLSANDISCVVPHQANIRIIEAIAERLGLNLDKFVITLDKCGNTSAASLPITLHKAYTNSIISNGDMILSLSFGAGLTWGASLLRWQK